MKKIIVLWIAVLYLMATGFLGCSDRKEITENAAKEAVEHIRNPIDKANAAKALEESHSEDIDRAAAEP